MGHLLIPGLPERLPPPPPQPPGPVRVGRFLLPLIPWDHPLT
jgi:hypothetical protein